MRLIQKKVRLNGFQKVDRGRVGVKWMGEETGEGKGDGKKEWKVRAGKERNGRSVGEWEGKGGMVKGEAKKMRREGERGVRWNKRAGRERVDGNETKGEREDRGKGSSSEEASELPVLCSSEGLREGLFSSPSCGSRSRWPEYIAHLGLLQGLCLLIRLSRQLLIFCLFVLCLLLLLL